MSAIITGAPAWERDGETLHWLREASSDRTACGRRLTAPVEGTWNDRYSSYQWPARLHQCIRCARIRYGRDG